jgi:Family of unknown function (DUF6600)
MNKYAIPLVCAAGILAPSFSSASTAVRPPIRQANHFVGYFQQDPDADVQTDSDSGGDYDVFYDRLTPDGHWLNDEDYGYVWQPNVAVSTTSWRPYSDGRWVWTDRGWFWETNENFGWATYHYGRWVLVDGVGWVWVPGRQWAPAWVSWRHTDDDDYVGWAPLPPESSFSVDIGIHPWCDNYYDIGPAAFAFIRIGDFGRPSYRDSYLPQQQTFGFFNRTTNITNITYNNNVVINNGPQYQRVSQLVQQQGGQPLPSYKINYAAQNQANAAFKTTAQGNQLNVLAPPQALKPTATVQPQITKDLGKTQVDRGWKNVPEAQAKGLRQQYAQQAPVPQNLPAKPVLPPKPQIQAATKGEQHPPTEPGKEMQAPGTQLKPFVEKPGNKPPGEEKKLETERAKTVQPKPPEPGEVTKQQPPVTREEEKKAAPATIQTEKPKTNEVRRSEGEQAQPTEIRKSESERAQPKAETRRPAETEKPAGREAAPQHKKEEPKKEPSPQARVSHPVEQHQPHSAPRLAEAHAPQSHPAQPHPKSNPPAQAHKAPANNAQKKKEDHKA